MKVLHCCFPFCSIYRPDTCLFSFFFLYVRVFVGGDTARLFTVLLRVSAVVLVQLPCIFSIYKYININIYIINFFRRVKVIGDRKQSREGGCDHNDGNDERFDYSSVDDDGVVMRFLRFVRISLPAQQ